jgi:hypothetical protein
VFENLEALPVLPVRTQRATGKRPSRRSGSAIKEYVRSMLLLGYKPYPSFFSPFPLSASSPVQLFSVPAPVSISCVDQTPAGIPLLRDLYSGVN